MVEPKVWELAYGSLVDNLGWGKGVPIAEFCQDRKKVWEFIDALIEQLNACGKNDRARRFEYLLFHNRSHFFYKNSVSTWVYNNYSENFKNCESSDVLISASPGSLKSKNVIVHDDISGHEYFDGKKIIDVSRNRNTKEIVSVVEPIVHAESHFKIVDYIFGHGNDFTKKNSIPRKWRSIFDIITKINEIKRPSNKDEALDASIEIHSVFDPYHTKEFYGEIIKQELPINCPVTVYSWKHSNFVVNKTNHGPKNSYDDNFDISKENPHERMFLTNAVGFQIQHGFDYALGRTEVKMFGLDEINRNNDKYTRGLVNAYHFHWVQDLVKLGHSKKN